MPLSTSERSRMRRSDAHSACTRSPSGLPDLFEATRELREEIYSRSADPWWDEVSLDEIRHVVLLLSPPRGGSSLLFEILRSTDQVVSLDGEHVPYFKLNGLAFPFEGLSSDQVDWTQERSPGKVPALARDLIAGAGVGFSLEAPDLRRYAEAVCLRLPMQWPGLFLSANQLQDAVGTALRKMPPGVQWNTQTFYTELTRGLRHLDGRVELDYYDNPGRRAYDIASVALPTGPPHETLSIEEPPFVAIQPRDRPTRKDLAGKPFLLKASIDAYRLPLLRSLFPQARFQVIHLKRNPAGSINGLYDGWLHGGFFSHHLSDSTLGIRGYSERFDWGRSWWNFDLPPGWEAMKTESLEHVCAFQWLSSHRAIIASLDAFSWDGVLGIRFEDVVASPERREVVLRELVEFLGIRLDSTLLRISRQMPIVMATARPVRGRWRARESVVWPEVRRREIVEMANRLGYRLEGADQWS